MYNTYQFNNMHKFLFDNATGPSPARIGLALAFGGIFFIVLLWSLVWKGMALWKAGRSGNKVWFVVLLVVNTIGILDILYIYIFSKNGKIQEILKPAHPVSSTPADSTDATVV